MEELFAAATGCLDPLVAASYLERAGYDLTRAVNHFLDSPKNGTAASRGSSDYCCRSSSCGDDNSGPRSLKRQRAAMAGEKQQQQQLLKFEHARRLLSDTSSSSVPASVGMPSSSGMAEEIHAMPCDSVLGAPVPKTTTAPSAGWEAFAERCQRQGAQYEDGDFLPVPSSLDGRIGRGCSASSRDCTGGAGTETTEGHARCKCGTSARVNTVNKAGVNQGRLFYGCVTRKCDFFRWADDAPHTRQALSLVWRRFSPPRFKLSSAAPKGEEGGGGSFKPEHVMQGAVGDCWFLAGLAVVSERADLIGRVVGSNGPLADELGCFEVNLFKDGRWESVVVDSWLPCKDPARLKGKEKGLDHLPAFAKAFNNQIWPCIVEKAFAKQHGSYDAISGGHVCDAFEALTGAPTETIMLDNDDSEGNWAQLLSFNQASFPMGCATAWDPTRGLRDVGLVSTHAYSVLEVRELPPGVRGARQPSIRDWAGLGSAAAAAEQGRRRDGEAPGQPLRLVRVRNPWGKREWIGDWGEKSEKWSDRVRAELGWSEQNDGTFWMTWQDFMSRFQLVDVCKARRDWSHASVTTHSIPSPKTCRSFRVRPPPPPMAANTEGQTSSQTTGKKLTATAATTSPTVAATPTTWAYITVVQPTKRGRKDGYWYKALGLVVAEMSPSLPARGDTGHSGGVLVASSLGGARRSLSCEVFLESGKAYTASVVCLGGEDSDKILSGRPKFSAASTLLAESTGFRGFRVTVYSARPLQIVPGEQRPASPGYFRAESSIHQALSRRSSEEILAKGIVGRRAVSVRNPLQSFALGGGAALSVVPMEGSALFFLLINVSSSEVVLRLTLTSLEGATVSTPDSQASPDGKGILSSTMCPARSQKIALVLARTADHGSFSHEFHYRVLRPAPTAPATTAAATATRHGDAGAKAASKTFSSIGTRAFAEATAATPSFGGGLFSAQALLPGAEELVRRAGGYTFSGEGGAVEGRGGSTVTGEDGGVGSAAVARRG